MAEYSFSQTAKKLKVFSLFKLTFWRTLDLLKLYTIDFGCK